MEATEGIVIFAQESRFQLIDRDEIGRHFILSHSCPIEPQQLPELQRNQSRVRVGFRQGKDVLASLALRIDLLDS